MLANLHFRQQSNRCISEFARHIVGFDEVLIEFILCCRVQCSKSYVSGEFMQSYCPVDMAQPFMAIARKLQKYLVQMLSGLFGGECEEP